MCQHQVKTVLSPSFSRINGYYRRNPDKDLSNYLEHIDKLHNGIDIKNSNSPPVGVYSCHTGWIKGECKRGHAFARAVMCDKEWCPDCGKIKSNIHKRRIERWKDKIIPMISVGYLVITTPEQFRSDFYDRKLRSAFRKYIIRKLKRDGFDKGLTRWHWAGNCTVCNGKKCNTCNNTGMSNVWKPHLNILIENGYEPFVVDPDNWINNYKQDIAFKMCKLINKYRILRKVRKYAKDLNCEFEDINLNRVKLDKCEIANIDSIVLHYSYTDNELKKNHLNNYVNRATWRYNDKLREIISIRKYRTTQSWGKWNKTLENTSELGLLEKGCCPECKKVKVKSKIFWGTFESTKNCIDYRHIRKEIDAGYFLLDLPPPIDEEYEKLQEDFDETGIFDPIFKGKYAKMYGSN